MGEGAAAALPIRRFPPIYLPFDKPTRGDARGLQPKAERSGVAKAMIPRGGSTGKESPVFMALPDFSMRQLLEAGVHFGHHTRRWNPKMASYLFGVRNDIHIIDLEQTVPLLHRALSAVRDVAAGGGRVLFVGTKRQAQEAVAEAAKRCGQYYVNHRWLGGMLTNFRPSPIRSARLRELDETHRPSRSSRASPRRNCSSLTRDRDKLERALGGIKEMGGLPDILFVIDTNKEAIAVAGGEQARHPGGRDPRFAIPPARHRLSDPRQ